MPTSELREEAIHLPLRFSYVDDEEWDPEGPLGVGHVPSYEDGVA